MKILKYLIQFFFIYIFFIIFRILGYKLSSNFSAKAVSILGPFFRSEKKRLDCNKQGNKQTNENKKSLYAVLDKQRYGKKNSWKRDKTH